MKRKLFSAVLGVFAMLLLMGAAAVPEQPAAALLAEEESAALSEAELETRAQSLDVMLAQSVLAATGLDPLAVADAAGEASIPPAPVGDTALLVDGQPAPLNLGKRMVGSTTYVSLTAIAQLLDPAVQISWEGNTTIINTGGLSMTAKPGDLYVVANGRYLYVPEQVQLDGEGRLSLPLRTVAEAFGASVGYDNAAHVTTVTRGNNAIQHGDAFYNQEELFWLSRVIYRESGNQPMEGQMAVGNVILNRVADPAFPNSVEGVLAQKNQFTTYQSGVLAATNPSQSSIIAAKLVLDGGVVEETKGALFFDSGATSWAARNREHIATIGGHKFYG